MQDVLNNAPAVTRTEFACKEMIMKDGELAILSFTPRTTEVYKMLAETQILKHLPKLRVKDRTEVRK